MKKWMVVLLLPVLLFCLSACEDEKNGNADLLSLTLANPSPSGYVFSSATTNYTVHVPNSADSIDLTPATADSGASLRIMFNNSLGWTTTDSGVSTTMDLYVGGYTRAPSAYGNIADIEVTAENGTKKIYTVTVIADEIP